MTQSRKSIDARIRQEDRLHGLYGKPSVFRRIEKRMVSDEVPGPGYYPLRTNSFGRQLTSRYKSEPSAVILGKPSGGNASVSARTPQRISSRSFHSQTVRSHLSKASSCVRAGCKFPQSLRPDIRHQLGVELSSPGPAYDVRELNRFTGRALDGPNIGFTRDRRFHTQPGISIGPGHYKADFSCMDRLRFSHFTFGASHRAFDKVRRPGSEHDRLGRESSGPGDPLWRNIKKDGSKAHSFNHSPRFVRKKSSLELGPGEYFRPLSRSSSCPSVFGTAPMRPRLDFRQLRYLPRV